MVITNPWFGKNKPLMSENLYQDLVKAGYDGQVPLVKYFMGSLTWLVTGIEDGILYGWADLGMGCVEWGGLISTDELGTIHNGPFWLERDMHFTHKDGADYGSLDSLTGI